MDRQILNITANEQILTADEPIRISTNKVNYIEARFDLGTNWSGYDSVRAVWFNDFNCISTVLDSLGNCVVPFEVMKRKGNVKVNLVGSISEGDVLTDRLTSYPVVAVIVDCTAQITGANTQPITPSEFEQFAQRVHTDADRAETAASEAETSAQNASDSATSAHDDKIAIEEAIAEVIQQIEDFEQVQVVVNTLPPSSPATSDFTDGVLTLGIPQGVKGDTGNGIQSIAKTGTSGLVDTYTITFTDGQTTTFNVTNGAKGDTGNGIQSIAKTSTVGLVDTYTITYTDGTTSTFTVTNGEKGDKGDTGEVSLSELESATVVQTLFDNTPYNYRRTNNGNGSGTREYDEIVGASVGWNQLAESRDYTNTNTESGSGIQFFFRQNKSPYTQFYSKAMSVAGQRYFIVKATVTDTAQMIHNGSRAQFKFADNVPVVSGHCYLGMLNFTSLDASVVGGVVVKDIQLFDLTQMFGSTIADYIQSLETATAGAGVSYFRSLFPKPYYAYNSGSIESVSGLSEHKTVGFNQWDEEWELGGFVWATGQPYTATDRIRSKNFQRCISNTNYYISANSYGAALFFYDDTQNFIAYNTVSTAGGTMTTPANARYFKVLLSGVTTYAQGVCINISDASKNGTYEPYTEHAYPLDSTLTLRGVPKLDASNNLYFDGDVYASDGTVTRKYGVVDLGSLTWSRREYSSDPSFYYFRAEYSDIAMGTSGTKADMVCPKYVAVNTGTANLSTDKTVTNFATNNLILIRDDAYTDENAFKTAMSGQYLVYEKATPTTETATPYTNPQWCDSNGTEEYVGSELPVGHNTDYPMSLSDTVPTASGNYTLKCTVTNGVPIFTWQSE